MNRIYVRDLCGRDHRRHIQITIRRPRRPNADRFVGKSNMKRIAVGFAINSDGANPEFRRDWQPKPYETFITLRSIVSG